MNVLAKGRKKPAKKYRPVLTADEVGAANKAIKLYYMGQLEDPKPSPIDESLLWSVLTKFGTLAAKIDNESITPAYTTSPKKDQMQLLGGSPIEDIGVPEAYLTKEDYWEACYKKYIDHPATINIAEMSAANEHRYLNGLMTAEQEKAFEKSIEGRELL